VGSNSSSTAFHGQLARPAFAYANLRESRG